MQTPTTIPALADAYGEIDAQIKALEKQRDALKAEMLKRKTAEFEGDRFTILRSEYDRTALDTTALKAALGEDIVAEYSKTTTCTRLTVRATAAPIAKAA